MNDEPQTPPTTPATLPPAEISAPAAMPSSMPAATPPLSTVPDLSKFTPAQEVPVQVANLQTQKKNLEQKIDTFGHKGETADDISSLRTYLENYYSNLLSAGEPEPDPVTADQIRQLPQFKEALAGYATLQQKMADLEKKYLKCTYGYQMSDGSILVPDTTWTTEQVNQVRALALQQVARCWLDEDKSQYA